MTRVIFDSVVVFLGRNDITDSGFSCSNADSSPCHICFFMDIFVVGKRINTHTNGTSFFSTDPDGRLIDDRSKLNVLVPELKRKGKIFRPDAEDFFIITPGSFDYETMPDFVIGRPAYDNQLVDHVYHKNETHSLIDVSKTVTAIHQTGADGNKAGHNTSRPDIRWNLQYKNEWRFDHQTTIHANWETRWKFASRAGEQLQLIKRPPYKEPRKALSARDRNAAARLRLQQIKEARQKKLGLDPNTLEQERTRVFASGQSILSAFRQRGSPQGVLPHNVTANDGS